MVFLFYAKPYVGFRSFILVMFDFNEKTEDKDTLFHACSKTPLSLPRRH